MSRVSQLYNPGAIYAQEKSNEAPEYTLAGVLRFLQTEWRNAEREKNEWEIERAELQSKLAILEGEKRANERTNVDLLRRIKMLEFSLRQEREKFKSGKVPTDLEKRDSPLSPLGPNFTHVKQGLKPKASMNTSSIISLKNRARKDKCREILKT
ncbi:1,2-dihydroxy-3-keto-5-methylthiopentene dioxygenase [Entomophthora muscae]|uniref:1,2-dihydroxy-3-keto-5-methylthiopentene dioxygenase n=1 Tax=Entomophthora muscae TaxID=34485 RepID=A0ACC2STD4_9FUNG|nr:1,2-dihydroxy-3-keto-5-methylthiopentene dioxygenase [Entomophthora muscae]